MAKLAHVLSGVLMAGVWGLTIFPSGATEPERQKYSTAAASLPRQEAKLTHDDESAGQPISVLDLRWTDRPVGERQTPRRFLDFVIDGHPLFERISKEHDYITPLGWGAFKWQDVAFKELQLLAKPELVGERQALYVCPECGDLDCGVVSAVVQRQGDHIIWKDFADYNPINHDPSAGSGPSIWRDGYEEWGPFVFDAAAYAKTLQDARQMLSKRPEE